MQLKHLAAVGLAPAMVSARALVRRSVQCDYASAPNSGATCQSFAAGWALSVEDLVSLNPGINCPNLDASKEYCVIGTVTVDPTTSSTSTTITTTTTTTTTTTPPTITSTTTTTTPPTITSTTSTTTTATKPPTTTTAGNGIATPVPTQSGMVGNCNKFHFVETGQTCDTIAALYHISTAQFIQWNPAVQSGCNGLWASTYACVGVISSTASSTGANGIATPLPAQPGMVKNCNKFVKINSGDTCDTISFWNGVEGGQYVKLWNGQTEACTGLVVDDYACIAVTDPIKIGTNGIATPLPSQPGMVNYCKKFVKINSGDTCDSIAFWNGVAGGQYVKLWNGQGEACTGLIATDYACIGI